MKHERFMINLTEWSSKETPEDAIIKATSDAVRFLTERGYQSLEKEISKLLGDFLSNEVDQRAVFSNQHQRRSTRQLSEISYRPSPAIYTTCLRKDDTFVFIDVEPAWTYTSDEAEKPRAKFLLEIDVFSPDSDSLRQSKDSLIDQTMKYFGLTGTLQELVSYPSTNQILEETIAEQLTTRESLNEALFQKLRESSDRDVLRELKKRGSILERDLQEIASLGLPAERVKPTLDYFSGEEYHLVERKYAIVCKKTDEIIFLLKDKQDLENAKNLECPKCSAPIGQETVFSYYESTDRLRDLLDGSRWMPLLVRDALVEAGVPSKSIYTEVKHGEDEIDVLVSYRDKLLVIELKDRPVTLNDAYKLSAKTSRLESVCHKTLPRVVRTEIEFEYVPSGRVRRVVFVPVVISTSDIAKDARDLLKDTRNAACFLEDCESSLYEFIREQIEAIDAEHLRKRLSSLVSKSSSDSVSNLASAQIARAFFLWEGSDGEDDED